MCTISINYPIPVGQYWENVREEYERCKASGTELTCKCQLHIKPPSLQKAEKYGDHQRVAELLSMTSGWGPNHNVAWDLQSVCHVENATKMNDMRFLSLLASRKSYNAYKTSGVAPEVRRLATGSGPREGYVVHDTCYKAAIRLKYQTRVIRNLGYLPELTDFRRAFEVAGYSTYHPMSIVKEESGVYHLCVDYDRPKTSQAGVDLHKQMTEVINGAPGARIGFKFSMGGTVMGGCEDATPPRTVPRGMAVTWMPPRRLNVRRNVMPTLDPITRQIHCERVKKDNSIAPGLSRRQVRKMARANTISTGGQRREVVIQSRYSALPRSVQDQGFCTLPEPSGACSSHVKHRGGRDMTMASRVFWSRTSQAKNIEKKALMRSMEEERRHALIHRRKETRSRVNMTMGPEVLESQLLASFHPGMHLHDVYHTIRIITKNVACPVDGFLLEIGTSRRRVKTVHFSQNGVTGVTIRVDGIDKGHFGPRHREIAFKWMALAWKKRALDLLRDAQKSKPEVRGQGSITIGAAKTSVPFVSPNLYRRVVNGFRTGARLGDLVVYSRSARYWLEDPRPGNDGFISLNQDKILREHSSRRLIFTGVGLARMWVDIGSRLLWKQCLARALGLTYHSANQTMDKWSKSDGPDLVFESLGDVSYNDQPGQIVHHFEEVTVVVPDNPRPQAKQNVKFTKPTRFVQFGDMTPTELANNNFVIGRNASLADIEKNPGPPELVLDPSTPSVETPASEWYARFYEDSWKVNVDSGLKSVLNDYHPKYIDTTEPLKGKFSIGWAGPHRAGDIRKANHQIGAERVRFARRVRRQKHEEFHNSVLMEAPIDDFTVRKDDRFHDVEENPGPPTPPSSENRGRSDSARSAPGSLLTVNTGDMDNSDTEKGKGRSASHVRRVMSAIINLATFSKDEIERLRKEMGFSSGDTRVTPQPDTLCGLLTLEYHAHIVIGHLPADHSYTQTRQFRLWSALWNTENQAVLDKHFGQTRRFSLEHSAELAQIIHSFFQKSTSQRLGRQEMAALAQNVKSHFSCPGVGVGFAVELRASTNEIVLHWTSSPSPDVAGRLWYYVSDTKYLHGGDDNEDHRRIARVGSGLEFVAADVYQTRHFGYKDIVVPTPKSHAKFTYQLLVNESPDGSTKMDKVSSSELMDAVVFSFQSVVTDDFDLGALVLFAIKLKSRLGCPSKGSYCIAFEDSFRTVHVAKTDRQTISSRDRCWILMDGEPIIHLGVDDHGGLPISNDNRILGRPSFTLARKVAADFYESIDVLPMTKNLTIDHSVAPSVGMTNAVMMAQAQNDDPNCVPMIVYMTCLIVEKKTIFWLTFFFWVQLWINMFSEHRKPKFRESSVNLFYTDKDNEDDFGDRSERLAIATLGSKGDVLPIGYLAETAAHYGIKTTVTEIRRMDGDEMEELRRGNVISMAPDYTALSLFANEGYKRVLVPHVDVSPFKGLSYTLSPSSHWIRPMRFVDDWSTVDWLNYLPAVCMEKFRDVFKPCLNIGNLRKGSNFPRTTNGLEPLVRKTNLDMTKQKIGWTSGSNNANVIPLEVRQAYDEVPSGDHSELFRHYSKLYVHGGAGTVQTAIACGCEVVICDPTMDRNYHTIPKPKDFSVPSIATLMGYLVLSRFHIPVPVEVKVYWVTSFLWHSKMWILIQSLDYVIKILAITSSLWNIWRLSLLVYLTIPLIAWKLMVREQSFIQIISFVFLILWEFPVLCLGQTLSSFALFIWAARGCWPKIASDFHAFMRPRFFLEFEPTKLKTGYFPFPYGHYSVRDSKTNWRYEGQFVKGAGHSLGSTFRFVRNKRIIKPWSANISIPIPFALDKAASLARQKQPLQGAYGASFNCLTLITSLVANRSVFGFITLHSANFMVWLALQPPSTLLSVLKFFGHDELESSVFYKSLGFAAGVENIPLTVDDEVEDERQHGESSTHHETDHPLPEIDSLQLLIDELTVITAAIKGSEERSIDDDADIITESVISELNDMPLPASEELPTHKEGVLARKTFDQIVDHLHFAMSFVRRNRVVDAFICWLKGVGTRILEFMMPILKLGTMLLQLAHTLGQRYFRNFFVAMSDLISYAYDLETSRRVKTAWGLTGLHKTGVLGLKANIALSIAHSEFIGRTDPVTDFERMITGLNAVADELGKGDSKHVGGPQRRPVVLKDQLMTKREAETIRWPEGQYKENAEYEKRVESKISSGVPQGSDGVRLGHILPDKIVKSISRYVPRYPIITSTETAFANEVADSLFSDYPDLFSNCDITTPRSIEAYNRSKMKFSPGIPFLGPNSLKTRQAVKDLGYYDVIRKMALDNLKNGVYPVQWFHAFVKAQVVDITKCLPIEWGGKDKDVRTVVAQDLLTYTMSQVVMFERNKRDWVTSLGAGAGMRLNQSMERFFLELELMKEMFDGLYILADATAFDSYIGPLLKQINVRLWDRGYENHPSGNGRNISSACKATYDANTSAWCVGVTEAPSSCLTAVIPDREARSTLVSIDPHRFVDVTHLPGEQVTKYVSDGHSLGKVLLCGSNNQTNLPPQSAHMGTFVVGDPVLTLDRAAHYQEFVYPDKTLMKSRYGGKKIPRAMYNDLKALANSPIAQVSNVHAKNRGGATGKNDTSPYNTVSMQGAIRAAWSKTVQRPPSEFTKYNKVNNTGDDTMMVSCGEFGLKTRADVMRFKDECTKIGVHLTIDTTKDITEVEYLSKFVRRPSPSDSEDLQVWRSHKIAQINHRAKQLGLPVEDFDYSLLDNPKYVVYHSTPALFLRSTAIRWYQARDQTWREVSMARTAGHANNTAFAVDTYIEFANEWVADANELCQQHHINRQFKVEGSRGKYKLPEVVQINPTASRQSLSPRQQAFLLKLKGMMFPSYLKVLNVHMNTADMDPEAHAKLFGKIDRSWRGPHERVSELVDYLYQITDSIPDDYRKFTPGLPIQFAERTFYTKNKLVEQFVYQQMLRESGGDEISFGDFSSRINEGPYACVTDAYGFYEKLSNPDFLKSVEERNPWMVQGLVFWITFVYALTPWVEAFILSLWLLGPVYKVWMWTFFGLGKLYGLINTLYWHAEGKSSREISRMMPKDPYAMSKRCCAFIVDLLPETFGLMMVIPIGVLKLLPEAMESIGKINYKATQMKTPSTQNMPTENKWSRYAEDYLDALWDSRTRRVYIAAGTGTGKSSWFIAALYAARQHKNLRYVWIVSPYKSLRNGVTVPFGVGVQVLTRGVDTNNSDFVKSVTYGHFLNARQNQIDEERDVVLFDEFHMQSFEMIAALAVCRSRIFLLSATPVDIPALDGTVRLEPDIQRRFETTVRKYDDTMDVVDAYKLAEEELPQFFKVAQPRVLVVVPTHKKMKEVIEQLAYLVPSGTKISPFSRLNRDQPPEGIIVATPYIDVGTDLKNPPDVLIDCGKRVLIDRGRMVNPLPSTDYQTNKQRMGRVSRLKVGYVYQPHKAGTGPRGLTYSSPSYLSHAPVASHFRIKQLGRADRPSCRTMPWMQFNRTMDVGLQERKSIALLHSFAYSGLKESQWEKFYGRCFNNQSLGEDFDFIDRTKNDPQWDGLQILPYGEARIHYNRERITSTFFRTLGDGVQDEQFGRPFKPLGHTWVQYNDTLGDDFNIADSVADTEPSKWTNLARDTSNCKEAITRLTEKMSPAMRAHIANLLYPNGE